MGGRGILCERASEWVGKQAGIVHSQTRKRTLVRPRTHTSISWPILATRTCERRVDSTRAAWVSWREWVGKREVRVLRMLLTMISQSPAVSGSVATAFARGRSCMSPISTYVVAGVRSVQENRGHARCRLW
jgi:hypothetical protein